jgi:transcriptional regulator with XRE-family HTH domain
VKHEQLRPLREKKGWTLEQLEKQTGVRIRLLEAVEQGRFGDLPTGLYGRAAVRAYAAAVGLPADEVLEEIGTLLRAPEDPIDGLARVRGIARSARARATQPETPPAAAAKPADLCFTYRPPRPAPVRAAIRHRRSDVHGSLRVLAATGIDAALLGAIGVALVFLTAVACRTSVAVAARTAGPAVAMLFVLIAGLYFLLLGGVRNATVGAVLAGVERPRQDDRLDVGMVFARTRQYALRESSILVDVLMNVGAGQRWLRAQLTGRTGEIG